MAVKNRNEVGTSGEAGAIGKAFLMWLLGVPGGIILLYLLFSHC